MHYCQYWHYMDSDASVSNVQKHIARCRFKMCPVNTACVPVNEQCRTLLVETYVTNIQALMRAEDYLLREHLIVNDNMQEDDARVCVYDWAEFISELHDSGRERHMKRIVDQLHAENFDLNEPQGILNDFSARTRFVHDTRNESLKTGFETCLCQLDE